MPAVRGSQREIKQTGRVRRLVEEENTTCFYSTCELLRGSILNHIAGFGMKNNRREGALLTSEKNVVRKYCYVFSARVSALKAHVEKALFETLRKLQGKAEQGSSWGVNLRTSHKISSPGFSSPDPKVSLPQTSFHSAGT